MTDRWRRAAAGVARQLVADTSTRDADVAHVVPEFPPSVAAGAIAAAIRTTMIPMQTNDEANDGPTDGSGADPHGDRAERTRRARVRHLLAPAEGARRSSSSGRSPKRRRISSSRRCCSSSRRIRTRTSTSTSIRRADRCRRAWPIFDTMQFIRPDVSTLCIGMAASMGAFLLAAGAKGKRFALPNSTVMIHQPLGRLPGPGVGHRAPRAIRDRPASAGSSTRWRGFTGRTAEQVERDHDRDNFLTAEQAKEYGIVDQVLQKRAQGG